MVSTDVLQRLEIEATERAEKQAAIRAARRFRLLAVNAEFFVSVLAGQAEVVSGLPSDAFVGRFAYDVATDDFCVQIYSGDFKIVLEHERAPRMDVLVKLTKQS